MAAAYEYDLGSYSRKITCANELCQEWFNRGLVWAFGFHHEEAIACFQRALEADPTCAMAHWGIAYSHGPNYNFHASNGYYAVSQQQSGFPSMKCAFESVQTAATLAANLTPVEKDLIEALQLLYCWPVSSYADHLAVAYSNAMRAVHEKYSDDADVAFLFAGSMMTLHPWKLWDPETGASAAVVPELQALLAASLERTGDHPGLCHLWIHLLEMSPTPELALPVCDRLRALSPDNPHLCHMPSHIDVLVGHYTDAIAANAKAIEADRKLVENNQIGTFFAGYAAHDYHMLVFAAMYAGQYAAAKDAALAMVEAHASDALLKSLPPPLVNFQEGFVGVVLHVYIRFGRWDEIADYAMPEDKELYAATVATLHYARAIMHGVKGELSAARAEQQEFERARASPCMAERVIHNNGLPAIMAVAAEMLNGELAFREGDWDAAWVCLRKAVSLDDALAYDEPWGKTARTTVQSVYDSMLSAQTMLYGLGWMVPARHALGALLAESGRHEEAIVVYKEDLAQGGGRPGPANPWALRGLLSSLEAIEAEQSVIADTRAAFEAASRSADVEIKASCACAAIAGGCKCEADRSRV